MECLMDHIVLNVEDMEKMLGFYTGVLELLPERLELYRAGEVPFPSVRLNPETVIDLFPKMRKVPCPDTEAGCGELNHFCITLEQKAWVALLERLQRSGTPIEEGPVARWGAGGSGISVYFRDPEHNRIEARYYDSGEEPKRCLLGT